MLHDIISREDARCAGLTHYFTGVPCRHGHLCQRAASNGICLSCSKNSERKWRNAKPQKLKEKKARHYQRHKPEIDARCKAWRESNRDKLLAKSLAKRKPRTPVPLSVQLENARKRTQRWDQKNPEKARAAKSAWAARNPAFVTASAAFRRAAKLRATPPWVDTGAIKAVYAHAAALEISTGVPHHVDHIVPLLGKMVCGLHVHWNLEAIPAAVNQRKSNKFIESVALAA